MSTFGGRTPSQSGLGGNPMLGSTNASATYHSIKGYSYPANPLAMGPSNRNISSNTQNDPYVAAQEQANALMNNPSLCVNEDGSVTYDPYYMPKNKKLISMASYDAREDALDPVEPLFWLMCAMDVGISAFVAFIVVSSLQLPFKVMYGEPIYIAACASGVLLFLLLLLFYTCSSKDERIPVRLLDGFIGGIPYLVLGALIGYLYSGLILLMVEVVNDDHQRVHITWWYMIFSSVPMFLLLFIVMFVRAMQIQEASSLTARIIKGIPLPPAGFVPRNSHIPNYLFAAFRRFLMGFALAVGLAAYYTVPCFALGWLAFGLYKATDIGWWLPIAIMVPVLMLLLGVFFVLLAKSPYTLRCLAAPWTGPFTGWSRVPFRSAYFPRYHVGTTVKQMVRQTNDLIRRANHHHVKGRQERSIPLYDASDAIRAELESRGIALKERTSRRWRAVANKDKAAKRSKKATKQDQ